MASRRAGVMPLRSPLGGASPGPAMEGRTNEVGLDERFRALRASIEGAAASTQTGDTLDQIRSVLVVGIDHGVASVGIGLATAFAQGQHRTLLVDADLRATGSQRLIRPVGAATPGLAEWLLDPVEAVPYAAYPTGQPNLSVLPAGEAATTVGDPTRGGRLAALLSNAEDGQPRDRVVVVMTPLALAADALLLARHADGVLLVVVPGRTTAAAATRARDALRSAGGHILGVVLDDPPAK